MHTKYNKSGLSVLGFPCNQFGNQEPGTNAEIKTFCTSKFKVSFDMFSKVKVNGKDASPFYKHLTKQAAKPKGAGKVTWNFEKFVIDRQGKVIGRFGPRIKPDAPAVLKLIEGALAKKK
jgi:glutathione peroxidase